MALAPIAMVQQDQIRAECDDIRKRLELPGTDNDIVLMQVQSSNTGHPPIRSPVLFS